MRIVDTRRLRDVLMDRFPDLVAGVSLPETNRLRVFVRDGSVVDVWFSLWLEDRYSYHWERRAIDGTLYRCDNAPHKRWASVKTFPHHFHDGSEEHVVESFVPGEPEAGLVRFMEFVRKHLQHEEPHP